MNQIIRLLIFIGSFGLAPVFIYTFQHRLIYFPRAYSENDLARFNGIELVYQTGQGKQVAFYVPPKTNEIPSKVWMLFGGNAAVALDWLELVNHINDHPYNAGKPGNKLGFLLVDYPGYGKCEGKASPETILENSLQAFATLCAYLKTDIYTMPDRLRVMGHSMGAASALQFAVHYPIDRIILISPFTTLTDMARLVVGWPFFYLLKQNFDNIACLSQLEKKQPVPSVTILHGSTDEIVPVQMGQELAKLFEKTVKYIEVDNADHNSILATAEQNIIETVIK